MLLDFGLHDTTESAIVRCMLRRKAPLPAPTGHDELLSVRDGHLARPASASLLDLSYDEVAPGRVVLGFRPTRRFADGDAIPAGVLAGVVECAMRTAVRTTVLASTDVSVTSLSIEHPHAVLVDSGPLRCEGEVVEPHRARATITDGSGRVVLRAEATCRIEPARFEDSVREPGAHEAA
jgi:acyl-coenzyme A thioesterase PaaI-like protein